MSAFEYLIDCYQILYLQRDDCTLHLLHKTPLVCSLVGEFNIKPKPHEPTIAEETRSIVITAVSVALGSIFFTFVAIFMVLRCRHGQVRTIFGSHASRGFSRLGRESRVEYNRVSVIFYFVFILF